MENCLCIKNSFIAVNVSKTGGEMMSVLDADGVEYIWQGDARYWKGRSPHLFPIIGRLFNDRYALSGKIYTMGRHGFFRSRPMRLAESGITYLMMRTESDGETYRQYPCQWDAELEYHLDGPSVRIIFRLGNPGEKNMYFAYGGHPGFRLPLTQDSAFEDYSLQFEPSAVPQLITLSPNGLVEGAETKLSLDGENALRLNHSLFDNDALILRNAGGGVTLKSGANPRGVTMSFPGMRFLSIWHTPRTKAPYICIGPMTSLPAKDGLVEDLEKKDDLICLGGHCVYENEWTITFGVPGAQTTQPL